MGAVTTYLSKIIVVLTLIINSFCAKSQGDAIDLSSIGEIVYDSIYPVGTGFVSGRGNFVITCVHIIDTAHEFCFYTGQFKWYKLKVKKILEKEDIALLEAKTTISQTPFCN
jgi:hypothetical protein